MLYYITLYYMILYYIIYYILYYIYIYPSDAYCLAKRMQHLINHPFGWPSVFLSRTAGTDCILVGRSWYFMLVASRHSINHLLWCFEQVVMVLNQSCTITYIHHVTPMEKARSTSHTLLPSPHLGRRLPLPLASTYCPVWTCPDPGQLVSFTKLHQETIVLHVWPALFCFSS